MAAEVAAEVAARQQLWALLGDNGWHYSKTASSCTCPNCSECPQEGLYLRLQPDGRFLSIDDEDAWNWYGVKIGSGDTSKLMRVGAIHSTLSTTGGQRSQADHEVFSTCLNPEWNDIEKTVLPNDRGETLNQDRKHVSILSSNEKQCSKQASIEPQKIAMMQIRQAEKKEKVQPPCHCQSCSTFFWFSETLQESLLILERENAATNVQTWARTSVEISEKLARGLQQHGKALHKRWAKKFNSTKQQHVKLLNDVYATLEKQGTEFEPQEESWFSKNRPFGRNARCRVLTTALSPDILLDDPDNLLRIFEDRSKHPSRLFYSDYHVMRSVIHTRRSIRQFLIPGTFNVTPEKYGTWQEWQDQEVHSFRTVAASVSMLVFESQSEILNVLWEIFQHLSYGLSFSNAKVTYQELQERQDASKPIPLPTMLESQSLYTEYPAEKYSLHHVYQLCSNQLLHAITELTTLRRSRKAFDSRKKLSEELHKATGSCDSTVPQRVFVEPYERVLWWLFIVEEAKALLYAFAGLNAGSSATTKFTYVKQFKSLMTTIRLRSDQVLRDAIAQGLKKAKSGAVVPASVLKMWKNANDFLVEFAFSEPRWPTRIVNRISCKGVLKGVMQDVPRVHRLVQEWSTEAMLITRVEEMMMACEPTIVMHKIEPLDRDDHVRHKLCPPTLALTDTALSYARCANLAALLADPEEQSDSKKAPLSLSEIWDKHQQLSLHYYERNGFKLEWLEKVEDVWVCTDPGEVVDNKQTLPPSRRAGRRPTTTSFVTTIPHHAGEERASARKLTVRTRALLNPEASRDKSGVLAGEGSPARDTELEEVHDVQRTVSKASFDTVKALFSNAQANTTSIRWQTFCNFMKEAGCEVGSSASGGASTKFLWTDPNDGKQKTLTLHRPHPVPTLEPQMLRNVHTAIKNKFGWTKESFIAKK